MQSAAISKFCLKQKYLIFSLVFFTVLLSSFRSGSAATFVELPNEGSGGSSPQGETPSGEGNEYGDPVDVTTGSLVYRYKALSLPVRGNLPFEIAYIYRSKDFMNFGEGGRLPQLNYDTRLQFLENGDIHRLTMDVKTQLFQRMPDGSYKSQPGVHGVLRQNSDASFTYTEKNGTKFNYTSPNSVFISSLHSIEDANGNRITLTRRQNVANGPIYLDITDPTGRKIELTYSASAPYMTQIGSQLLSIKDLAGNSTLFQRDNSGNLTAITDPEGNITSFEYHPNTRLLSKFTTPRGAVWQYEYDALGNCVKVTDPDDRVMTFQFNPPLKKTVYTDRRGNSQTFEYDVNKNITRIIDPLGNSYLRNFDADFNITSIKNQNNQITSYSYDPKGNIVSSIDALGNKRQYTYEPIFNSLTSYINPLGKKTTYIYDLRGNLTAVTGALGNKTIYTYDSFGQLLTKADPNGNVSAFEYDVYGNLAKLTDALSDSIIFQSDILGNFQTIKDARGNATAFVYDKRNLLLRATFPDGGTTSYLYDGNKNLVQTTDPLGQVTKYSYDKKNYLVEKKDPLLHATIYDYDEEGNMVKLTDANTNSTMYTYDSLNRLISATNALGDTTEFTYDNLGNLLSMKDPNKNLITFLYDPLNRKIEEKDPLGNKTIGVYDKAGNIIQRIDPNGKATSYSYDALNRLIEISYPDHSRIIFEYDQADNLTQLRDKTGITKNFYDKKNRVIKTISPKNETFIYTYDKAGNTITLESAAGVVTYTYDSMNRKKTITSQNGVTIYTYDKGGRRISALYPNKIQANYTYDNASRLLSLIHKSISNPNIKLPTSSYTYDNMGNRLTLKDNEGAHIYAYDKIYQLKSAIYPLGNKSEYIYDKAGNRLVAREGLKTTAYVYDKANRLLKVGNESYIYDKNGNLIQRKNVTTPKTLGVYCYDFENRMTQSSIRDHEKTITANYQYDGFGRRIQKSSSDKNISRYHYDGMNILYETDRNQKIAKTYTHGQRLDEILSMNNNVYLYDGLGSATSLTNSQGQPKASYTYDVFGELRSKKSDLSNDFLFAGRQLDSETSLYYYRNRYYNPAAGRFTTKDPIGLGGGTNVYTYVRNNPINYIDPLGLEIVTVKIMTQILTNFWVGTRGIKTIHAIAIDTDDGALLLDDQAIGSTHGKQGIGDVDVTPIKAGNIILLNFIGEAQTAYRVLPKINYNFSLSLELDSQNRVKSLILSGSHDGFPTYSIDFMSGRIFEQIYSKKEGWPGELAGIGDVIVNKRIDSNAIEK